MIRKLWQSLEAVHAMIYFVPEAAQRYSAAGLDRSAGYFASRSAALGKTSAEVVISTFYNFNPALVRSCLPAAWDKVTPEQMLTWRLEAADEVLSRVLPDDVEEIAALATRAAERSTEMLYGRTLFAAHASLPWPEKPHLRLWHASTLLREFRGDGHLAALLQEGLSGLEALILRTAEGDYSKDAVRKSRGWSEEQWGETEDRLHAQGLLTEEKTLSEQGVHLRKRVEDNTDRMAEAAYDVLTDEEKHRWVDLAAPLSRSVVEAGLLPFRK